MCAWGLGRIGGPDASDALTSFLKGSQGQVKKEVAYALTL